MMVDVSERSDKRPYKLPPLHEDSVSPNRATRQLVKSIVKTQNADRIPQIDEKTKQLDYTTYLAKKNDKLADANPFVKLIATVETAQTVSINAGGTIVWAHQEVKLNKFTLNYSDMPAIEKLYRSAVSERDVARRTRSFAALFSILLIETIVHVLAFQFETVYLVLRILLLLMPTALGTALSYRNQRKRTYTFMQIQVVTFTVSFVLACGSVVIYLWNGQFDAFEISMITAVIYALHPLLLLSYFGCLILTSIVWVCLCTVSAIVSSVAVQGLLDMLGATLCFAFCLYANFQHERRDRLNFFKEYQMGVEYQKLHQREEILKVDHTMLKYDYHLKSEDAVDHGSRKNVNWQSPLEEAMMTLRRISRQYVTEHADKQAIKSVCSMLSNSKKLYAADLSTQINTGKVELDSTTSEWLNATLITDNNAVNQKRRDLSRRLSSKKKAMESFSNCISTNEEMLINQVTAAAGEDYALDVFDIARRSENHPLLILTIAVFRKFHIFERFPLIDVGRFVIWIRAIERDYNFADNPYHNSSHAADVLHTTAFFLFGTPLGSSLPDLALLCSFMAAIVHDVDHPGLTNNFLIGDGAPMAVLYNDRSVLENHHASHAFTLLYKSDHNFMEDFATATKKEARKLIIDLVLATDLAQHFSEIGQFRTVLAAAESGNVDVSTPENRLLLLKIVLKCGDVNSLTRPPPVQKQWTERIIEEFYQQGDKEKELSLPPSPFMDREKPQVPQAQLGFIDFIVQPLFQAWVQYAPEHESILARLRECRLEFYQMSLDEEQARTAEAASGNIPNTVNRE